MFLAPYSVTKNIVATLSKREQKELNLDPDKSGVPNEPTHTVYRNAMFVKGDDGPDHGAVVEIDRYHQCGDFKGFFFIACDPAVRGRGLTDRLIRKAIGDAPKIGFKRLVWVCEKDNIHSSKVAERNGLSLKCINEWGNREYIIDLDEPIIYHGSGSSISGKLEPKNSGTAGKHLFATPSYAFAVCFAGKQWNDLEINQCTTNGKIHMTEIAKGAFKRFFGNGGYIYELSSKGFHKSHGYEVISDSPAKILGRTKIDNPLKEMLGSGVVLHHYPELPPHIKDREKYIEETKKKYGIK